MDGIEMANDVKRIYVNMCRPAVECRYMRMRSVGGMISDSEDEITWKETAQFSFRPPRVHL